VDAVDLDAVDLQILAAGEVQRGVAPRRGDLGRDAHLCGREDAANEPSTEHVRARFALLVDALRNAEGLERAAESVPAANSCVRMRTSSRSRFRPRADDN